MTAYFTFFFGILFVLFSRYLFKKWFNHLAIYTANWMLFICLYEIKLIKYIELSNEAWFAIVLSYFCFFIGVITFFFARKSGKSEIKPFAAFNVDEFIIFRDGGRLLKIAIIFCGIIGLAAAIQHWMILIKEFGSVTNALIKINLVYRMRVEGKLVGTVPYLYSISFVGVFLSGLYLGYKNKFNIWMILPFIAVIIKEMASAGRAGLYTGFLEFNIGFFLIRNLMKKEADPSKKKYLSIIGTLFVFLLLFVASSTLVKTLRGTVETFKASTSVLNKTKGGAIISPSIYMYFSSNVGVFSKYLEENNESALFGENTFLPFYNLISYTGAVKHPDFYPKGYNIPMWSNSATYLRDLNSDFGPLGLYIVPYLLGLITTYFWFRFYENKNTVDYIILGHLFLIIAYSTFYILTRSAAFLISFLLLFAFIKLIERQIKKKLAVI